MFAVVFCIFTHIVCVHSISRWSQIGESIVGAPNGNFGQAIAINYYGDIIAVGSPDYVSDPTNPFSQVGLVEIWQRSGNLWTQVGSSQSGSSNNDAFGRALSLNAEGDVLAISGQRGINPHNDPYVRTFKWNTTAGNGWWELIGWTDGDSLSLNDDGDKLAVGLKSQCVRVFQWVYEWTDMDGYMRGKYVWTQIGADIDDGVVEDDETGHSVSLNGDGTVVAVGATGFDDFRGQVRVFKWNGTHWGPLGSFIDGEYGYPHPFGPSGAPDEFGRVVELNTAGDVVSVSSSANSENGGEAGHVRVFKFDGNDWIQMGADIDGKGFMDQLGVSMSLNEDGTIVAIGALGNKSTRIFRYDDNNWNQLASDIESSGSAVAINGDGYTVAVKSPDDDIVRILHFNQTAQPTTTPTTPTSELTESPTKLSS